MPPPSPATGIPLGLGVTGEDSPLANPYSRKRVLASSTPRWKSALRSRGNRGDGVGGTTVSKLYAPLEVDRLIGVGAGALILGKADTGLLKAESSVTMMVGDCSGVGRGRRSGRSFVVAEDRRRPALYRRASLYKKKLSFRIWKSYKGLSHELWRSVLTSKICRLCSTIC